MHAIFMLYGKVEWVDIMLRDMRAQKHKLRFYKEGEKDIEFWMESQVRLLPFGVYEYIFPKEDADRVLTTLNFDKPAPYSLPKTYLYLMRKVLKALPIPEFKTAETYLWIRNFVSIIPIGIKYDGEIIEPANHDMPGWTHEAI